MNPLLTFPDGCLIATFRRREKRFLVEVETGRDKFWVHCNNSGSMLGLLQPGREVLISPALRPGRRLPYTLELVKLEDGWVGVNTLTPNRLLQKSWEQGVLAEAAGYQHYRSEAKIGASRLDAALTGPEGTLWIEAKNVTLVEDGAACFPDAVTQRGQKHLLELMALAAAGHRVACFYLVQRSDAACFAPADFIDPDYAKLFWQAVARGIEIWPYQAAVSPAGIALASRLPIITPPGKRRR